jgi:hypothetical protein
MALAEFDESCQSGFLNPCCAGGAWEPGFFCNDGGGV